MDTDYLLLGYEVLDHGGGHRRKYGGSTGWLLAHNKEREEGQLQHHYYPDLTLNMEEKDILPVGLHSWRAPFSYLILYCLIVNESSGPKRVTHHIFYSVHIHISKDRVILTIPHRISNPKSLISLQPRKAFMQLS